MILHELLLYIARLCYCRYINCFAVKLHRIVWLKLHFAKNILRLSWTLAICTRWTGEVRLANIELADYCHTLNWNGKELIYQYHQANSLKLHTCCRCSNEVDAANEELLSLQISKRMYSILFIDVIQGKRAWPLPNWK